MVSLLDYDYDYGYVLTTRFFTNGDFITIRAIYIKSSDTFLPCIILLLSKLYAVDHCLMENNLKYYNEYTSVSKSFKNDAGISNYSMLFCINLLNVANTISKIVIIISSTLYAIHQFTLYILMYIACTAYRTLHVLLISYSTILQSYNNVNLSLMNMIFKINIFCFAPLYYMQRCAFWIRMRCNLGIFTHTLLMSCSTILLNFYNVIYTWRRFNPSYHTDQHISYTYSLVMCRNHLVVLCNYKHIYSSFQQLYQRWCCLIIILKCTLTAKFVKCYPLKYCCPLIINNDILVLCDLAHFMNSLISFPLISFTTFTNDLIFMTLYLIVSHSSRINATNCNFFLVLSKYVEVIYSITTSMQKLQYYSTDYLGGGQSICMLLALLTGAVS